MNRTSMPYGRAPARIRRRRRLARVAAGLVLGLVLGVVLLAWLSLSPSGRAHQAAGGRPTAAGCGVSQVAQRTPVLLVPAATGAGSLLTPWPPARPTCAGLPAAVLSEG